MAYQDFYRLSSHAVITNANQQILLLKASYADQAWGLPGGGLDVGETIHQALYRECKEELGLDVQIEYLSGVYFHAAVMSHAFIFRCHIQHDATIQVSHEHSEYRWFDLKDLTPIQKIRVQDCLDYSGEVRSRAF
ncbi:NUDIX domain-containing protein [Acinetobacter sp. 194]|uniref:NUDIX hydrolase n=1 Tax=Acinetobacter shaoyimingii TaxID=2715164 RepID=UPI00140AC36F|nr:NUDIX domain-containing protein [Acinetobacter shaoyimingii]NHB58643.1 NUDIX domain-containing protein [Acinetobacter shaoyimingii]